jgi:hypothetical protein
MWQRTEILKARCRQDAAVHERELFARYAFSRARLVYRSSAVSDRPLRWRGDRRPGYFPANASRSPSLATNWRTADVCRWREGYGQEVGAGEGNRTLVISLEGSRGCCLFKDYSDKNTGFGLSATKRKIPLVGMPKPPPADSLPLRPRRSPRRSRPSRPTPPTFTKLTRRATRPSGTRTAIRRHAK